MRATRLLAVTLAFALLAPSAALAQKSHGRIRTAKTTKAEAAPPGAAGSVLPPIQFTEYRLANGLRVIMHEDHSTPIVGVNLWYHVGSKNEVPGKTGFAHLFEHMMFQGSKHYDDNFFTPLQEAGGTLNGSTNPDRTNYWEVVPSNFLETALFMEADRMGTLTDVLTKAKLDNQRDVVKNEKRQNYDNRPYGLVRAKINATLYPKDHPYHWLTIGSLDDLTAASLDDVKDFFRRFYTPNNASLCLAGDFNPAQARQWVEKYFGPVAKGPAATPLRPMPVTLKAAQRIEMQDRVALPRVYLVWPAPPQFTPDEAPLDTLATILGGGKSSRLYKTLVYERQIAQDVFAFNNAQEIAGQFQVVATAKPGKTLAELEGAINEELENLKNAPPTAEEIERAYNARESAFIYSLQTIGGFGGKNDQLNAYATFLNKPGYFQEDLARYRSVTAMDVQRVAKSYLTDARLVANVTPRAKGQTAANGAVPESPAKALVSPSQQTAGETQAGATNAASATTKTGAPQSPNPDRPPAGAQAQTKTEVAASTPAGATLPANATHASKPVKKSAGESSQFPLPAPQADPNFKLPKIERRRLSNGLEVLIVQQHEVPVVNMNLVLKTGAAADPAGLPGVANLTAAILDEGTKTRNALDISNALAAVGARFNTAAGWDATTANLLTLTRHLDRALDIYADVLTNPAFAETDLKRLRASRLALLQQHRDDANSIADVVYSSLLYGRNHPYGHPQLGDEASVGAIKQADLQRFYETYYRPNNASLIVAGDITPDALVPKLERAFANWKRADVPAVKIETPTMRDRAAIYLVDKPGAAQSVIDIGQVGVARSTPDYFPLLVLNTMLGGQFVSRVNLNLREDKGYTYGARTSFDYRRAAGPFAASAGVQTAATKESVVEFMKELRGIRGEIPITGKELEYSKQAIIRGFPRGFETSEQIADRLTAVVLYDLPDDYFNNFIANVRNVKLADVQRVADRYLDPSRMAILVVGDRKVVEPGLRALEEIGPTVTLLDTEGRPVNEGGAGGSKGVN